MLALFIGAKALPEKDNAFKECWCSCYDDRSHLDFAGALSLKLLKELTAAPTALFRE